MTSVTTVTTVPAVEFLRLVASPSQGFVSLRCREASEPADPLRVAATISSFASQLPPAHPAFLPHPRVFCTSGRIAVPLSSRATPGRAHSSHEPSFNVRFPPGARVLFLPFHAAHKSFLGKWLARLGRHHPRRDFSQLRHLCHYIIPQA